MSRKNWGYVLIGAGVILILLGVLADTLGIVATPGFGIAQIAALIIGFVLLLIGLYLAFASAPTAAPVGGHAAPAVQAAPPVISTQKDDLTRLEGIGPKVQELLYSAGLTTYSALAKATPEFIESALKTRGIRVPFDPTSWPGQAALAADGKWAELNTLQESLSGGRHKG